MSFCYFSDLLFLNCLKEHTAQSYFFKSIISLKKQTNKKQTFPFYDRLLHLTVNLCATLLTLPKLATLQSRAVKSIGFILLWLPIPTPMF